MTKYEKYKNYIIKILPDLIKKSREARKVLKFIKNNKSEEYTLQSGRSLAYWEVMTSFANQIEFFIKEDLKKEGEKGKKILNFNPDKELLN